jgi:hypothetical protein
MDGGQVFFESKYLYHGVPRLAYFWVNPNHAAAVLVALIAVFWALRLQTMLRGWKIVGYVALAGLELFWSLLIGWTCSRGALVAWVVALLAFGLIKINPLRRHRRETVIFWTVSLACLLIALLSTGSGHRFVDIADGDRSAWNRLGIWSNALKLIYAAPLSGWGAGYSGNALVQWFEPISSNKDYAAVVGTYLHIGAEFGIPALGLLLAVLAMTLRVGCTSEKNVQGWRNILVTSAVTGLTAFMVAGLFSTLWVNYRTSCVAGVLTLLIWGIGWNNGSIRFKTVLICLTAAALAGGMIYGCASYFGRSGGYTIRKFSEGVVIDKARGKIVGGDVIILVDKLILGNLYGKAIRRISDGVERWQKIYVYTERPKKTKITNVAVVVFGPRITELSKEIVEQAIVVCPLDVYSKERYGVPKLLIMPEYDEFGYSSSWLSGVHDDPGVLRVIKEVGQDCSSRLPDLIGIFSEEKK